MQHRLWLRDELIIDTSSTFSSNLLQPATLPDETVTANSYLTLGDVIRIRAEYVHHGGGGGAGTRGARVVLGWESAGTPAQAVPPFVLYPVGEDIADSPFRFSFD